MKTGIAACAIGLLTIVTVMANPAEERTEGPDPAAIRRTPAALEQPGAESASGATEHYRPLKTIDGVTNDWSERPVWIEGGSAVSDPGYNLDIKQVYVTNDRFFLYVFIVCRPSVAERFRHQPLPVKIGEMFFDVDNNPATGSSETEMGMFGYGAGYEAQISLDVAVLTDAHGRKLPQVTYRARILNREGLDQALEQMLDVKDPAITVLRQLTRRLFIWKDVPGGYRSSGNAAAKIAHGQDGVEFRVPLALLGISPGQGIRIMLAEEARNFNIEGYGVRYHTLE